jgi:hypothetical protein
MRIAKRRNVMHTLLENDLERLARTLVHRFGVEVVCKGDNACTDGQHIVLPSMPQPLTRRAGDARGAEGPRRASGPASQGDPLDEGLERMMVGYLDHEMAHVAFSDFKLAAEFGRESGSGTFLPGCLFARAAFDSPNRSQRGRPIPFGQKGARPGHAQRGRGCPDRT